MITSSEYVPSSLLITAFRVPFLIMKPSSGVTVTVTVSPLSAKGTLGVTAPFSSFAPSTGISLLLMTTLVTIRLSPSFNSLGTSKVLSSLTSTVTDGLP